jgi:DNA replication protein DnaC
MNESNPNPLPGSSTTQAQPSPGELLRSPWKELAERIASAPDTGPTEEERAAREAQERAWRMRDEWRAFIRTRGERYRDCRLDNYQAECEAQSEALARIQVYADDVASNIAAGRNVLLIGPPGTGKDHLLVGLARYAVKADASIHWCNGTDVWGAFRDNIGADSSEGTMVARFTNPGVLMMSDPLPPRGPLTDFQAATLFRIIDRRYNHCRPTWMTLNVGSGQEARDRLGWQTIDRLSHDAVVVACNWPSYRKPSRVV